MQGALAGRGSGGRAAAPQVAELLDVGGVPEQQVQVVVDRGAVVVAAVVGAVLPAADGVEQVLERVASQGLVDAAFSFVVQASSGPAGRRLPGVEDFLDRCGGVDHDWSSWAGVSRSELDRCVSTLGFLCL